MDGLQAIQQEMDYTSYDDSCQDKTIMPDGQLRECRRIRGHWNKPELQMHLNCASGYPVAVWKKKPDA